MTTTRDLVDEIYNTLNIQSNVSFTGGKIVPNISGYNQVYVGKEKIITMSII